LKKDEDLIRELHERRAAELAAKKQADDQRFVVRFFSIHFRIEFIFV